jgi:triosephosphate isomerase
MGSGAEGPCNRRIDGDGHVPTPAEIAEMHVHIRSCLTAFAGPDGANIRIFYGAFVTLDNVAANLGSRAVGGIEIGGAF